MTASLDQSSTGMTMTNPSPPDWRGLCQELLGALENEGHAHWPGGPDGDPLIEQARAALAQAEPADHPAPAAAGEVGELVQELRNVVTAYKSCHNQDSIWSLLGGGVNARLTVTLLTRAADLLERQAAPVPGDHGVLPMIISETGAADEPELERITCAWISGGADYVSNMPRELCLERITPNGSTFARYIHTDADTHTDGRPAPAPAGEVES